MAKSIIFTPTKLEKIKPNPGLQRRNSTGGADTIFSQPNPIPNYLRASIGSCHDLCKYGARRENPPEESSRTTRNINMRPEAKSTISNRAKKVPETKNLAPAPSRKQSNETSKSTCNARASRNDEVKKPSVRIPTSKIRRSQSVPKKVLKSESQKLLESPETCKITDQCETVAEKIIHVVEADDRNQNKDLVSSVDQKQELDSAANNLSPIELDFKREEVVEREREEVDGFKERRLRRVFSEGDFDHKQNERSRLIVISKNKVKALVQTFETLMST